MELCLGTVQFGMKYGLNQKKQPPFDYSIKCLDYATQNGVSTIDTAAAYGNAEQIVGCFLSKETISRDKLFISTKMLPNSLDDIQPEQYVDLIKAHLEKSLQRLHTDYVDAFFFHSSRYAFQPQMIEALRTVQAEGFTRKIGVSIYEPDEALACAANPNINIVQVPYSVFDHRLKDSNALWALEQANIEVHVRSAFLQGLILMEEDAVPSHLADAKPTIRQIDALCKKAGISRAALAIAYIKRESSISRLVFGIHSIEQLQENIDLFGKGISEEVLAEAEALFADTPTSIVIPSLWKK